MNVYFSLDDLPRPPLEPVATLGNLDGVHRGHKVILSQLVQEAKRLETESLVITFQPHTRQVLRPDPSFRPLMSTPVKLQRLYEQGIDHVLVLPFADGISEMMADEFVEDILWEGLKVRSMIVGTDCAFGKNRSGTARSLASLGRQYGFHVSLVDPLVSGSERVSSSRIREAVRVGQLGLARQLLGHDHIISGEVVRGFRRGRELGYPTANMRDEGLALPPFGVYAGWAFLEDESRVGCMMNIGTRPTFDGQSLSLEVHLFDLDQDLYGQVLRVAPRVRLRAEVAFESVDALKAQLRRDEKAARQALGLA